MNLMKWREANRYSHSEFAKLLELHGVVVTKQAVMSWEKGTLPRKQSLIAIQKATGGKVKPASFL